MLDFSLIGNVYEKTILSPLIFNMYTWTDVDLKTNDIKIRIKILTLLTLKFIVYT